MVTPEQSADASSRSSRAFGRPAFRAAGGLPMHSTAAGYAPLAVAGGTQQRCEICSVGRAERRCARFAQRRSSPQGSSPRRPVEVSSGLLRRPRLHAPSVADDAARARRPSGHTAAPPPRRRSEPPRAPWHLRCPAALGGERTFAPDFCASWAKHVSSERCRTWIVNGRAQT